jgi:predicted dehydrogenase
MSRKAPFLCKPLRVGQLGVGGWGRHLVRVFGDLPGAELVAVHDPDPRTHARVPPGVAICRHEDDLFARDDLDALVVATPPDLHHPQAKRALERGLHVFVEKPLARRLDHAEELCRLAEDRGRVLMVGHVLLYTDAVRWVRDFLEQGGIGTIHHAELKRLKSGRVRRDVDALWNLAPHDISIVNYWFGEVPSAVRASGVSVLRAGVDDIAHVDLDFPSGRTAHIHVSWIDPTDTRRAIVVGSAATIVHDESAAGPRISVHRGGLDSGDVWSPDLATREPLESEALHFVDCVRAGRAPLSDGRNGASVVAVLEAATRRPAVEVAVA